MASIRKRKKRSHSDVFHIMAQVRIGSASKLASVPLKAEARLGSRRRGRSLFIVEGVRQVDMPIFHKFIWPTQPVTGGC